ncbi:hypothetical protein DFH94DRAFT_694588 [Russula ochroleuca]|uniref:Uncharacterized protein n=1 Tax=Russula ochroleuca TaxID=152965 RepID=A0A9P5MST5_9AGAM|nr:hypothetical protein DFH94DRAFT_694588 [Russula ochroleuca]
MSSQQQYDICFPWNTSPAADAPWDATAFTAPQHPRSVPSSYPPVPGQLRGHAGVVRDAVFLPANATGNHRPDDDWVDMPPPVDNTAAQGQPQDLRYIDMGHYDMANDHPQHRDHATNNAEAALDVRAHVQAAPPDPEIDIFDDPARNAPANATRAFPDERPHRGPLANWPANEVLRELAMLYLREPNSRVAIIRVEPGRVHGVRVVIHLELADL